MEARELVTMVIRMYRTICFTRHRSESLNVGIDQIGKTGRMNRISRIKANANGKSRSGSEGSRNPLQYVPALSSLDGCWLRPRWDRRYDARLIKSLDMEWSNILSSKRV